MIFLFGTQKSGTTWLRNIISQFVGVSAAYEWQIPRLVNAMHSHVEFCGVRRPPEETREKCILASRRALKQLIASEGPHNTCDKSAYPALSVSFRDDTLFPYHVSLTRRMFPSSKNIQIVRDPRDVLASSKSYFNLSLIDDDEVINYVNSWSKCNLSWIDDDPDFVLRFEDLKQRFEETVSLLLECIGVRYTKAAFQKAVDLYKRIDLSKSIDPTFYRQGVVGAWQYELSKNESDLICKHGSIAMRVFGYA
ncbi:hypothetical protein ABIC65_003740 [Sphingomonas trueperi]|uniref:sulfotransferase family protein n=1 Tax=Sphingomonas trueperi TaxID=53317 RepID=UPI0033914939